MNTSEAVVRDHRLEVSLNRQLKVTKRPMCTLVEGLSTGVWERLFGEGLLTHHLFDLF